MNTLESAMIKFLQSRRTSKDYLNLFVAIKKLTNQGSGLTWGAVEEKLDVLMNTVEGVKNTAKMLKDSSMELRYGQSITNASFILHPEMTEKFIGTELDPYYDDKLVDKFLEEINKWLT